MVLVSSKYLLDRAYQEHFAIGAFNAGNSEFVKNIITVAENLQSPVIIQIYPLEYELMGSKIIKYVLEAAKVSNVPIAVHLDHGRDLNDVLRSNKDQLNSVMIDISAEEFAKNVAATSEVVDICHRLGIAVEAELGSIGNRFANDSSNMGRIYTDPNSAKEFIEQTQVDFLAVSIGTVHGPYPSGKNEIRIDILKEINRALKIPLVLHGGSKNPDQKIKEAIENGIAKVNISTDIKLPYFHAIKDTVIEKPTDYEPWIMLKQANQIQKDILKEKILLFGSNGKASEYLDDFRHLKPYFPYEGEKVEFY